MTTQSPTSPTEEKKPAMSRAEKIFDWLVYGGLAGVGTFIATIPMAYWSKYGGGTKIFNKCTNKLIGMGFKPSTAEQIMDTNATVHGGNLMILAVKACEDHKIKLVSKIADLTGEEIDKKVLEQEDKQSWTSLIKARVTAWLTVFSSLKVTGHIIGEDKFGQFQNTFSKHIVCDPLGKPTHVNGQETKLFKYGKIGAIDVFATTAATTLLYIGSKIFAHWEHQNEERQKTPQGISHTVSTPAMEKGQVIIPAASTRTTAEIVRTKSSDDNFSKRVEMSRGGELQLGT